jgi:exportin-5
LEALHALYSRLNFNDDEFIQLVVPLYDAKFVELCVRLFEWSTVDAQDIDDDKYQFAKKFSEVSMSSQSFALSLLSSANRFLSQDDIMSW